MHFRARAGVCLRERGGGWEAGKGRSESNPCILVTVTAA